MKSHSRRPSRSASKLCATCSRRTRRVLKHRYLYPMYFYDAVGIKSLRFPLPHLYPGAAIYKAAVVTVTVTVNANVIVNETHCRHSRTRSSASRLSFFVVLCLRPSTLYNGTKPLLDSHYLYLFSSSILLARFLNFFEKSDVCIPRFLVHTSIYASSYPTGPRYVSIYIIPQSDTQRLRNYS